MEVRAKLKNLRMSPRKVRLLADIVRGLEAGNAFDQLRFAGKLAAKPVMKLLGSAVANAENNFGLSKDNLYIKEIKVDEGATLKRWMPKAHGRATPIRKRSSHITLVLSEIKETGSGKLKIKKTVSPIKVGYKPKEAEGVKVKGKKEERGKGESASEKGKKIVDPRMEGRRGHTKIEGGAHKGFVGKMFRRKSG